MKSEFAGDIAGLGDGAEAEIGGDEEQHEDRDDEALLPPGGAQLELRHSALELS